MIAQRSAQFWRFKKLLYAKPLHLFPENSSKYSRNFSRAKKRCNTGSADSRCRQDYFTPIIRGNVSPLSGQKPEIQPGVVTVIVVLVIFSFFFILLPYTLIFFFLRRGRIFYGLGVSFLLLLYLSYSQMNIFIYFFFSSPRSSPTSFSRTCSCCCLFFLFLYAGVAHQLLSLRREGISLLLFSFLFVLVHLGTITSNTLGFRSILHQRLNKMMRARGSINGIGSRFIVDFLKLQKNTFDMMRKIKKIN